MRTSDAGEMRSGLKLTAKLEDEATAWRKRRGERPTFSMNGIQIVRIPKRRSRRPANFPTSRA